MTAGTRESQSSYKPIYVIVGKDPFLVDGHCQKLLDKLLTPDQRPMALFNAEPDKVACIDVLDELRTLPFLADKRVVLIKGADDFVSQNRPLLEKYFDSPSRCGILILTVSTWPKATKLAKKLAGVGQLITAAELKSWQLPQYLMNYAKNKYGKTLTRPAAQFLVELIGDDIGILTAEVEKLATYADADKAITDAHIEALIGHNRLYNAFAVIDAMTAGDTAKGIERLRKMFAADKNAHYTVVGAFAFHFRRMFGAKALLQKGHTASQIASKLGLWGNKESFFSQLNKMTLERIGSAIQQLARIDYAIKTGRKRPEVAIEQMVLDFAECNGD